MNITESYKRNCAECSLHVPIGNRQPIIVTDAPARADLRRLMDERVQQWRSLGAHSPDFIRGTLAACRKLSGFIGAEFQFQDVSRTNVESMSAREGNVAWAGAHRFEFAHLCRSCGSGEGETALILPIYDFQGNMVDLAAWDPKADRLGTWLGSRWALGQDKVFAPRMFDGLLVHRTPLGWLRVGGEGVVIVNAQKARSYLVDAGPLVAEDVKHRRELETALAHPLPRILVAPAAMASKEG